jgi:fluoride exporter
MKNLFYIFIGGGTGSLVRYFFGKFVQANFSTTFPYGTLAVNVVASFILGAFVGSTLKIDEPWRALISIGFCGGFSTFSTFSNDTLQLMISGRTTEAFISIFLNIILCLLATYIGILIVK